MRQMMFHKSSQDYHIFINNQIINLFRLKLNSKIYFYPESDDIDFVDGDI